MNTLANPILYLFIGDSIAMSLERSCVRELIFRLITDWSALDIYHNVRWSRRPILCGYKAI